METHLVFSGHQTLHRTELIPSHEHHKAKMNSKMRLLVFLFFITSFCYFLGGHVSGRILEYFLQLRDTRPCACETCLSEDDPWFMRVFNRSVEPFLSAEYNLSEDAFNWWKVSCHHVRKHSLKLQCGVQSRRPIVLWKHETAHCCSLKCNLFTQPQVHDVTLWWWWNINPHNIIL